MTEGVCTKNLGLSAHARAGSGTGPGAGVYLPCVRGEAWTYEHISI